MVDQSVLTGGPTVVFAGPTIDAAAIQNIVPDAIVRPPAAQADIVNLVDRDHPAVIALIDGVFDRRLSVWYKELLYALSCGVHVYGASSMGALRAAETHRFGTVGVGQIFEWYTTGIIDGDDEVALIHGDADDDYRALSIPLVNVRATLLAAEADGEVTDAESTAILSVAKRLHYMDRNVATVLREAAAIGSSERVLELIDGRLRTGLVDQKRADAVELLQTVAALPSDLAPHLPNFEFEASPFFVALRERDRTSDLGGRAVSFAELGYHLALYMPDFERFNRSALDRLALVRLAAEFGIAVDETAVAAEVERHRRRHDLLDDAALDAWCQANDLTDQDFRSLMHDEAVVRRLRHFAVSASGLRGTSRSLGDVLRLRGEYSAWMTETAATHDRAGDLYELLARDDTPLVELLAEHARAQGWTVDTDATEWIRESGFPDAEVLRVELLRARAARRAE
ncbi:MAG: TfuA-like protein [Actinomycetota bacterium]